MPARCLESMQAWSPRACGLLHGILRPGDGSHSLVCNAGVTCCYCWLVIVQQTWLWKLTGLPECRHTARIAWDCMGDTQSGSDSRSDVRSASLCWVVATKHRVLHTLNTTLSSSAAIAAAAAADSFARVISKSHFCHLCVRLWLQQHGTTFQLPFSLHPSLTPV
jgi:hypothetical protein